jgi:integrase
MKKEKSPNATHGIEVRESGAVQTNATDLIHTAHYVLPYSIIKKQPELQEYIPTTEVVSELQLLRNKSTSRAIEVIREFTSDNTRSAYMGDLVYWQAWLGAIGFSFTHALEESEIITFIIQHAEGIDPEIDQRLVAQRYKSKPGPHKLSTIKRRIASLSVFLEGAYWPNPCKNKAVKQLLNKLTKKYGGTKPAGKAITRDILDDILETCGTKLIDVRDKALLLFAWGSGGRRRSEVTAADAKDLTKIPDGSFVYTIPKGKTDQEGKGHPVPVRGRAAYALTDWLTITGITEGSLFRAIGKGGEMRNTLSPIDIYRIVKRRLKAAGYDYTQFGAHSLRSGFVTEAGRRGKSLGDVMQLTTHRSIGTVMRYYQAGNIIKNSAANLAD